MSVDSLSVLSVFSVVAAFRSCVASRSNKLTQAASCAAHANARVQFAAPGATTSISCNVRFAGNDEMASAGLTGAA